MATSTIVSGFVRNPSSFRSATKFFSESPELADISVDLDALAAENALEAAKPKFEEVKVRAAPRQAEWFPMLLSPIALDGSLAGG